MAGPHAARKGAPRFRSAAAPRIYAWAFIFHPCGASGVVAMSLLGKRTVSAAVLAANRINAKKSTGPRTSRGRQLASLNSLKHGLRSRSFGETLFKTSTPMAEMERLVRVLLSVLMPRNRPEAVRVVRYAQMLWAITRRLNLARSRPEKRKAVMALSKAEGALHRLIRKDFGRSLAGANYRRRRESIRVVRFIQLTDFMARSGHKNRT